MSCCLNFKCFVEQCNCHLWQIFNCLHFGIWVLLNDVIAFHGRFSIVLILIFGYPSAPSYFVIIFMSFYSNSNFSNLNYKFPTVHQLFYYYSHEQIWEKNYHFDIVFLYILLFMFVTSYRNYKILQVKQNTSCCPEQQSLFMG